MIAELRRRNVFRVAAAYVVVAWLLMQGGDILLANFEAPAWVFKSLVAFLVLGLPLAVFLAWAYELTPEGVKRTRDVPLSESVTRLTGRKLDFVIIGVLVLALGWFAWDKFGAEPTSRPVVEPGTARASVAVLPFVNLSPDPEQEYFSDGLSEEILNLLAGIRELKVIGRTSSFAFKGRNEDLRTIAAALDVAYLLEGSVRKAGDRLRITAQLIQASDGSHLWSQSYDRRLEDVFAIQDEIAGAIARSLQLTLTGQASTADIAAYERYLQARTLIYGRTTSGLQQARALIDEALAVDPAYAPAVAASGELWLLLADHMDSYGEIPSEQAYPAARAELQRALALNPELADAHAGMGLLFLLLGDYDGARAHLARALAINPSLTNANHWQAMALARSGRARDALAAGLRFAELDPLFLTNLTNLVNYHLAMADYAGADRLVQRLQRSHADRSQAVWSLAVNHLRQGRLTAAAESIERALAMDLEWPHTRGTAMEIYFGLGDFDRALQRADQGTEGWLLVIQGEPDAGIAHARAWADAASGNQWAGLSLLEALLQAGRPEALLDEVNERWGGMAGLRATMHYHFVWSRALANVASAQFATGRETELRATLDEWGEHLAFLAENGHASGFFLVNRAQYRALNGDREAALADLAAAIDAGWRDPLMGRDAAFAHWQDDPDFQAQVTRMTGLINAERAKLGMEPLL